MHAHPAPTYATFIQALEQLHLGVQADSHLRDSPPIQDFLNRVRSTQTHVKNPPGKVIVLEGLDGTGKSTLAQSLAARTGWKYIKTPSPQLAGIRPLFDASDLSTSRAFYSVANYLGAVEILQSGSSCIIDRYYYSTICYGIGQCNSVEEIQALSQEEWTWPGDLLQPDLILLLKISEQERKRRLSQRNEDITINEQILEDTTIRDQIFCSYQRIPLHKIELDASGTPQEVLEAALEVMTSEGLLT